MVDDLLQSPAPRSYDLKLRAQHHPPTNSTLLNISRLLHAFISRHAARAAAALGGARRSLLLGLLSNKACVKLRKMKRMKKKRLPSCSDSSAAVHLISLLPHCAMPPPPPPSSSEIGAAFELLEDTLPCCCCCCCDPSWNAAVIPADELRLLPTIAGLQEWPGEDEGDEYDDGGGGGGWNEIDWLAERFIARCHERFMLEKQESYRRHQEMLARSL
ncbi:hypothetical protein ACP4OV_007046 [Aristida adscensionis]